MERLLEGGRYEYTVVSQPNPTRYPRRKERRANPQQTIWPAMGPSLTTRLPGARSVPRPWTTPTALHPLSNLLEPDSARYTVGLPEMLLVQRA